MANTSVVIGGAIADAGPPAVARSQPLPLTPDSASYAEPTPPTAPLSQYRPGYNDDRPLLPFPFFFGR